MDSPDNGGGSLRRAPTIRHACSACYKLFNKKEHLIEHMKISYHSVHQPKCGVCQKHCKTFESLREHLKGSLAKEHCLSVFSERGCNMCLKVFDSSATLNEHAGLCRLSPVSSPRDGKAPSTTVETGKSPVVDRRDDCSCTKAIAIDCEMVGGGIDGSVDLCARVCLVDEDENVTFHTYVNPQSQIIDFRSDITGITEDHLRDAMPLKEVHDNILKILSDGASVEGETSHGGKAKLLVGHDLAHDLDGLRMRYPANLLRDTAKYRPLLKTNLVSHSLKYLTKAYLGYDIQTEKHDPYEDCVSAMRLYKRMRALKHKATRAVIQNSNDDLESFKMEELEKMTPDELYEISKPDYRCWCLDTGPGSTLPQA